MFPRLIISALLLSLAAPVLAAMSDADYRQEFKQYSVYPCYEPILKRNGLDKTMSVETFYKLTKALNPEMEQAENEVLNLVRGKPKATRLLVYHFGLEACLGGIKEAMAKP